MCQRSNEIPCLYRCYTMSVDAIFKQRFSGTVHSWIRPEYWCKTKIKYYFGILTTEPTLLVQGTHTNNKKEQHIKTRWVEWDTSECGDCITEMFKEEAKCLNCSLWVVRATGGCQILLFRGRQGKVGGERRKEVRDGKWSVRSGCLFTLTNFHDNFSTHSSISFADWAHMRNVRCEVTSLDGEGTRDHLCLTRYEHRRTCTCTSIQTPTPHYIHTNTHTTLTYTKICTCV